MPIDISDKEQLDVPLTGTQMNDAIVQAYNSKDAIANIEGMSASASEIDGIVKTGEFGEVAIKIDTLPSTLLPSNTGVLDIHHQSQQGISTDLTAMIIHNYTDSKAVQLDNVGSGDILRLKNAHNSLKRLDQDSNFVGTGNFLVCEDSEIVDGVEVNTIPLRIDSDGAFRWQTKTAVFKQTKSDDSTWAYNFDLSSSHRYPYRFENAYTIENFSGYINMNFEGNARLQASGTSQIEINNTTVSFLKDVNMSNIPISDPLIVGKLWNDNGTLKISAG